MMYVVNFVWPFSQLQSFEGDGLVGGNPTMNIHRLRRGGGIASPSLVLLVLVLLYSIPGILFVTQLPSWSNGLYFLFGVFLP